jgi:Ca2+-binding EF-hand superfamily protein
MDRFPNLDYTVEDIKYVYRAFQKDPKNGFVSADELRYVITQLGELKTSEVEEMIRYFDGNGDNYIELMGIKF